MSEVMEKPEVKERVKAKKFKITIHSGETEGEKGDVFLSYNFKPVLIQRDQPVTMDEGFLEALKHTVIETTARNEKGDEIAIRIPRFNYSVEPA